MKQSGQSSVAWILVAAVGVGVVVAEISLGGFFGIHLSTWVVGMTAVAATVATLWARARSHRRIAVPHFSLSAEERDDVDLRNDLAFWGSQGRVGHITAGEWAGRLVFAYPDSLPEWWTLVVDPSPRGDRAGELYSHGTADVMATLGERWQVDWLPRDDAEELLERERFGWRPLGGQANWIHSSTAE